MFLIEMLRNGLVASRNGVVRFRRRFNLSFWCAVYNIFLAIMLVVSLGVSALGYLSRSLFGSAKDRVRNFLSIVNHNNVVPIADGEVETLESPSKAA